MQRKHVNGESANQCSPKAQWQISYHKKRKTDSIRKRRTLLCIFFISFFWKVTITKPKPRGILSTASFGASQYTLISRSIFLSPLPSSILLGIFHPTNNIQSHLPITSIIDMLHNRRNEETGWSQLRRCTHRSAILRDNLQRWQERERNLLPAKSLGNERRVKIYNQKELMKKNITW